VVAFFFFYQVFGRAASRRNSLMRTSGAQAVACSRRAIRSITFGLHFIQPFGGSATIPLAKMHFRKNVLNFH
jgi:hypothetical protein